MNILLFDTAIASTNIGDVIIMDAIVRELTEMFPNACFVNTATHEVIGRTTYRLVNDADYSFVCGTNLLSSNMNYYNQWKINLFDSISLRDIILMGVGWWQYQRRCNLYTRILLRQILNKSFLHAARDEYTVDKLKCAGITNVINTGCPTMWRLTEDYCSTIPTNKANSCVFTLTDYKQNKNADVQVINTIINNYEKTYFWPQGVGDKQYFAALELDNNGIIVVNQGLKAYDNLLSIHSDIDYVGTRLHAGIRAMQHKKRSIILSVDNRSEEIGKDTKLEVLPRAEIERLSRRIQTPFKTQLQINQKNIEIWKRQFSTASLRD